MTLIQHIVPHSFIASFAISSLNPNLTISHAIHLFLIGSARDDVMLVVNKISMYLLHQLNNLSLTLCRTQKR